MNMFLGDFRQGKKLGQKVRVRIKLGLGLGLGLGCCRKLITT